MRCRHHVRNDDVRRKTEQAHLSATVQAQRLSLVGHISRMPDVKVKTEFPDISLFSRKWEPCQHHN